MLDTAATNNILDYNPQNNQFIFHPIKYQFQCLICTTDTYYRRLTGAANQDFGILVEDGKILRKNDISEQSMTERLKNQLVRLEDLLGSYSSSDFEENIEAIQAICNHEYLHQGQILLLFREAGVDVPERFKDAFAL